MPISVEKCRRPKRPDRQVLRVEELSAAEIEAIAGTEMAAEHSHLDAELDHSSSSCLSESAERT
jgi:hypothetical protein